MRSAHFFVIAIAMTLTCSLGSVGVGPLRASSARAEAPASATTPVAPATTPVAPTTTPAAPTTAPVDTASEDTRRQQVLVHGEGVDVTIGEVEDALAKQGPSLRARYRDPSELKRLVDSLVRAELLAGEAARRGYEAQAAVRYTAKDSAAQALVRAEVEDKITPQTISADELRAYYEAHPAEFHRTAMRRASHIALDSADEAARLLPEATKADARAFAELAKQHSKDATTKPQGGDLGYFAKVEVDDGTLRDATQPKVPPALREAVFALGQVGDTRAQPLELGAQLSIVRFTAERPERHVSLDDAALSIRAKLWRERRQQALDALYASLRAKDKPQIFTDRIYQISFDDMERRPGGFAPDPLPLPAKTAQPSPTP